MVDEREIVEKSRGETSMMCCAPYPSRSRKKKSERKKRKGKQAERGEGGIYKPDYSQSVGVKKIERGARNTFSSHISESGSSQVRSSRVERRIIS